MIGAFVRLLPLYRPYLGWIALSLIAAVAAALAGAGLMAVSGGFIAMMAGVSAANAAPFAPSMLVRLFASLRTGARYAERVVGHEATLRIVAEARGWLFAKLAPLAPGALEDLRSGDVLARLKTDIDRLETVLLRALLPIATATIASVVIVIFIARYDARLAVLFAALALAAGYALPLILTRRSQETLAAMARLQGERRSRLIDTIGGLAELTVTGAFGRKLVEAESQFARHIEWEERQHRAAEDAQASLALSGDLAVISALALAGLGLAAGRFAPADASMLTLLAMAGFEPLAALPAAFAALPAAAASIRRILDLADRKPLVEDPADPLPLPAKYDIAFSDVAFSYPTSRAPVLDGVNLSLPAGARFAISGGSGAGKTTLIELLLRIRDPSVGEVRIGGVSIDRLRIEDVRSRFAVAPQFPHLFDRSLADNLRLANPSATEAEMRRALEIVGLSEFVGSLPAGLDSDVGPLGARLSGGQARRVAVARALLSKASVIILDEPTEGLDSANEQRLIDALLRAAGERTVILIAHTRYPLSHMQKIIRVEDHHVRLIAPPAA